MKPFDLQAALNGAPICTEDGDEARIISEWRPKHNEQERILLVGIIDNETKDERVWQYTENGTPLSTILYAPKLMMATTRHISFINLWRSHKNEKTRLHTGVWIHSTEEDAIKAAKNCDDDNSENYIRTIKIGWEE